MVSFKHYVFASLLLSASAFYYAFHTRKQFYTAAIFLTSHKLNIMVLVNLCFLFVCLLGQGLKRLFLGTLTRDELEELVQSSKYAITETMLALTIFREELDLKMLTLFTALLFGKMFHWLAAMRVESIARAQEVGRWRHIRLMGLMAFLAVVDWSFIIGIGLELMATKTASVLLLFGFEYLILSVQLATTWCKYVLLMLDARWESRGQHWHNKTVWMFYLEFSMDLVRLFLYLLFFLIICTYYGLPLHLIRELGLTFYTLRERIVKFIQFRRVTRNMHERFPDATEEELQRGDRTCIVCREDMEVGNTKKLPCQHMFHFACLRTWLERAQSCPTCRAEIPANAPAPPPQPNNAANANRGVAAQAAAAAGQGAGAGAGAQVQPEAGAGAQGAAAAPAADNGAATGSSSASASLSSSSSSQLPSLPPGLSPLPPHLQVHLDVLRQAAAQAQQDLNGPDSTKSTSSQSGLPGASPSTWHPLFGAPTPAPLPTPLHPLVQFPFPSPASYTPHSAGGNLHLQPPHHPFGGFPSPAHHQQQQQQQQQQHPPLSLPPIHISPLHAGAGFIFPPPPPPPPPAHLFGVNGGPQLPSTSSLAPASFSSSFSSSSSTSPRGARSSSSLSPSDALYASYLSHHSMLLQHHMEFLHSSLAQVRILFEQQREVERKFREERSREQHTEEKEEEGAQTTATASSSSAPAPLSRFSSPSSALPEEADSSSSPSDPEPLSSVSTLTHRRPHQQTVGEEEQ